MISQGHLVQDWMGRVGITLGPCKPSKTDDHDPRLERVILHVGGSAAWWRVALFSGDIVESPEPATDSLGPVNKRVLDWAIRRADGAVAEELRSISPTDRVEPEQLSEGCD